MNKETNKFSNRESISWDDYFAIIALMTSIKSDDPDRQVGAVIVSEDNTILAYGYNGAPKGINPEDIPWAKDGDFINTKYAYVLHAEKAAIFGYTGDKNLLRGAKIYTTLFPCSECMKAIIQSGITEVIYLDNHNYQKDIYTSSRLLVTIHNRNSSLPKINLREYKISSKAKFEAFYAITEERPIINAKEVSDYDETLQSKPNHPLNLTRKLK